ncbi:hypothetical protein ARMSODRAFT_957869 [Armillaria solidipes]|uniref:Uncharacterized protein n=1 Tax=Armillaria solidipes TaxID=1076256 RepID=A0A2H3BW37_9AGAR|nr:hypothetical protein ARMSODRAFT_957869 [Armillaria solidipes]
MSVVKSISLFHNVVPSTGTRWERNEGPGEHPGNEPPSSNPAKDLLDGMSNTEISKWVDESNAGHARSEGQRRGISKASNAAFLLLLCCQFQIVYFLLLRC